jgi:hypothetical protein
MQSKSYTCEISIKLEFYGQIFENTSSIKFQEIPSSGSRIFSCGRTDRHTLQSLLAILLQAPKNLNEHICHMFIFKKITNIISKDARGHVTVGET